jgi:hypothetical protein
MPLALNTQSTIKRIVAMTESDSEPRLSGAEKWDLVIQASVQRVPVIGGSLATIYFGAKQERRFKRLETFYEEVSNELNALRNKIASVEQHNEVTLVAILEELHERVERESTREKREYLKNYFKKTLIEPVTASNFDERRFFLDTLDTLSLFECTLLGFLYDQEGPVKVGNIQMSGVDQYAIVGAVGRLKTCGFLESSQSRLVVGGGADNMLMENVSMSSFGRRFCEFCIKF